MIYKGFVEDQQRLLNTMIDSFQQRLQERRKTVDSIVEELDELNSANYQLQQGVESIEFQIKSLHQNILTRK